MTFKRQMCPLSHLHSPYQAIIIKVSNDDVTFHLSLPLNSLQLTAAQLTLSVDWLSCTLDRRLEFKHTCKRCRNAQNYSWKGSSKVSQINLEIKQTWIIRQPQQTSWWHRWSCRGRDFFHRPRWPRRQGPCCRTRHRRCRNRAHRCCRSLKDENWSLRAFS